MYVCCTLRYVLYIWDKAWHSRLHTSHNIFKSTYTLGATEDTVSFSYSIGLLRHSLKRADGLLPLFCKNLCWASLLEIVLSNQFECGKYMVYFPLLRSKALIYSSEREREGQFTFFLSSCGSHLLYADVLGGSGVVAKYRHTHAQWRRSAECVWVSGVWGFVMWSGSNRAVTGSSPELCRGFCSHSSNTTG